MSSVELLARARQEGNPVFEAGQAWVVWEGPHQPAVVGDFNRWDFQQPLRLGPIAERVWAVQLELPADAYVEYVLCVEGERKLDPLNRHKVPNGLGDYNNFFSMPSRQASRLARAGRRKPVLTPGRLATFQIPAQDFLASPEREVTFYAPPAAGPVPLLVVYDGMDYLRIVRLARIVDRLVMERQIGPLGLAFIENGGDARSLEYSCAESTLRFVLSQVIPAAETQMPLLDINRHPGAYGVLGASMGGLMALYSGLRHPEVFGRVLAQSGAYTLEGYEYIVWDLARQLDPACLQVWMDVGSMEALLDCNRAMFHLLQERGLRSALREYSGGHNYTLWRNDLPEGLSFLFGS